MDPTVRMPNGPQGKRVAVHNVINCTSCKFAS